MIDPKRLSDFEQRLTQLCKELDLWIELRVGTRIVDGEESGYRGIYRVGRERFAGLYIQRLPRKMTAGDLGLQAPRAQRPPRQPLASPSPTQGDDNG